MDIKSDSINEYESLVREHNIICVEKIVTVKPENLFDEGRTFTLEADLLVEMIDPEEDISNKQDTFVKDMASIVHDDKNADVLVRVEDQVFKCHKTILSAKEIPAAAHSTLHTIRFKLLQNGSAVILLGQQKTEKILQGLRVAQAAVTERWP